MREIFQAMQKNKSLAICNYKTLLNAKLSSMKIILKKINFNTHFKVFFDMHLD